MVTRQAEEGGFLSKGKHLSKANKAGTVMIAGFSCESRSSDKPVVTRQVQGQTKKSSQHQDQVWRQ